VGVSQSVDRICDYHDLASELMPWAERVIVDCFQGSKEIGIAAQVGQWQQLCRWTLPARHRTIRDIVKRSCQLLTKQFVADATRPIQRVNQRGCEE